MNLTTLIDQFGQPLAPVEKAAVGPVSVSPGLLGDNTWHPLIREPFAGAWQRNMEMRADTVFSNVTLFRCISLISGDIAKLRPRLITESAPDVWDETTSPSFSPVLAKPNHYQNRIQFYESWIGSKLATGNTFVLKERNNRGIATTHGNVVALYILDPRRVRPMVADNGDIFYRVSPDNLVGLADQMDVPASEIIHDRWNCLFHPLVGLSPIYANHLAAMQGVRISQHSLRFFENSANPGGVLTAPGRISNETANRLKAEWQEKYSGNNAGLVAVLGDGLKFESMGVNALNSQLIEQLQWTSEMVAASYGVPSYKVGVGQQPNRVNVEELGQEYYQNCLQIHIESLELCLDEGLALPDHYGIEFDLDGLLRMDTATKMKAIADGVGCGVLKPDEGRRRLGLGPVPGGDTPYLQMQNFSLAALSKRDARDDPFSRDGGGSAPSIPVEPTKTLEETDIELYALALMAKELGANGYENLSTLWSSQTAF
jgi:HK97 family phage portal protein